MSYQSGSIHPPSAAKDIAAMFSADAAVEDARSSVGGLDADRHDAAAYPSWATAAGGWPCVQSRIMIDARRKGDVSMNRGW
jgi:hypothetical protein